MKKDKKTFPIGGVIGLITAVVQQIGNRKLRDKSEIGKPGPIVALTTGTTGFLGFITWMLQNYPDITQWKWQHFVLTGMVSLICLAIQYLSATKPKEDERSDINP